MLTKNHTGIYVILHVPTGRMYIGQSKCIMTRWSTHKRQLINKKHCNKDLQKAWNSSKEADWVWEVLETCSEDCLDLREQHYINIIGIASLFNRAWSVNYVPRKKKNGKSRKKARRSS